MQAHKSCYGAVDLELEGSTQNDQMPEEEFESLTKDEILFLRSRSLDTRSITVLSRLRREEVEQIRNLIKGRKEREQEIFSLVPDEINEDLEDDDVFAGEEIDEDGLGKSERVPRDHRWPFKKVDQGDEDGKKGNVDQQLFFGAVSCHDNAEFQDDYKRAVSMYKRVITATPETPDDSMFRMFAFVNLGILRQFSVECKDENEASKCFKKGAVVYREPVSTYFYGKALVHGVGGVKRNIPKGIGLLNRAGAHGVALAYFELGRIYESGVSTFNGGSVDKNGSRSRDFYRAAGSCYLDNLGPLHNWTYKLYAAQTYTAGVFHLKSLLPTDEWHGTEDVLSSIVGNRFSWSIAGQAFLFGGAASLSSHAHMEHYSPLLVMLPILGMVMAFFSLLHIIEVVFRNDRRRGTTDKMLDAKIKAYRCHLSKAEESVKQNVVRYQDFTQRILTEREELHHHENTIDRLKKLSSLIELTLGVSAFTFFIAWLVLLTYELVFWK
eukprot:CAMPEP_0195541982 /NCGR_PEP_ID=MMETSP0794_2-20130614/51369_1 /TAXON_ID=515487 /ORGANISM="Stephanopyxis turris, Strain CCMP 815" /LENGTH=494 /DNA_ID=CAMNT_0040676103 /DNA_START=1 /DNA_END=1485 /DNA_ORIENTATION=+